MEKLNEEKEYHIKGIFEDGTLSIPLDKDENAPAMQVAHRSYTVSMLDGPALRAIIEKEKPVDVSNVAIWNSVTNKADRVGFRFLEDGQKVRYFKSNNEVVDV